MHYFKCSFDLPSFKSFLEVILDANFLSKFHTPQFYLMAKVHKNPVKYRPVISCSRSALEIVSKWLDICFQEVVKLCPGYLQDSYDLLECPQVLPAYLVMADATLMYTNILMEHGIQIMLLWLNCHQSDLLPDFLREFSLTVFALSWRTMYLPLGRQAGSKQKAQPWE
jgi:hypothetical protein